MKNIFSPSAVAVLVVLLLASCSHFDLEDLLRNRKDKEGKPERIVFVQENLFPEGVEYDKLANRFLVTSITNGNIGQVQDNGHYSVLIEDEQLISTIGIHIDHPGKRILVAVSDLGASVKSTEETQGRLAALAAYDLRNGNRLFYADLGSLRPERPHFANDVTVDKRGNAYVTDSFSGIIYRVDEAGNAEIFYEDEALNPEPGNFGLNGIDYDNRGYLLVSKIDEGKILRFPIENPEAYTEVDIPVDLPSPDGLYLKNPNELIVVSNAGGQANGKVHTFRTNNKWETASLQHEFTTPDVFPTTATVRNGSTYVLYAYLHVLLSGGSQSSFQIVKAE